MQELIGFYITMEEYFMRETVNKVGHRTHPLEMGPFCPRSQAEGNGQACRISWSCFENAQACRLSGTTWYG